MKIEALVLASFFVMCSALFSVGAETIKIGSIFAKTGETFVSNRTSFDGIRFAVQEINKNGGLLGKQLELLEFDNQGSAVGSKIAAQKAVKAGVVTVFGANWSSHSLAAAPVLQKAGIPMITPISTNPKVTLIGDYIFRVCYIDSFQGAVMANFAFHDLKVKNAAVLINANSKYSEGLAKFFIQSFKGQGGKILFEANYLEQTADFSFLIDKIKSLKPEVVFLPGHSKDSAFIIRQARDNGLSTTFLGGDGWDAVMCTMAGSAIEGSYFTDHWHKDRSTDVNHKFVASYEKYSMEPDAVDALTYDSVQLFADAVRRAGLFQPDKIRDALAATDTFEGVTGIIDLDKNGDPVKSAVILRFDKGTIVYVKSVEP